MSGPKSAQMVLQNPTVDTAVFEVARGGILREGLGYDRNDVAVVTNVTGDHLGLGGIDSIGQLANVKGVVVEAVPRSGTAVLNADDSHVYRMGRHCARPGRAVQHGHGQGRGRLRPGRRPHQPRRGRVPPRAVGRGRAHRPPPRVAHDAGPVHPPHPGDVRRSGADERGQRPGGSRRGLGGRRPPARHPPGPADLLDVVLPGPGPAQPARCRRRPGRDRLLPQRGRDAPAGRFRGPDDGRATDEVGAPRRDRRHDAGPAGRSASSGSRATGATRTSATTGRSPRRAFDEIIVREDKNLRGRPAGEAATHVLEGVKRAKADGTSRTVRAEKVLEELTAVRAALRRANPGDLVVCCVDDAIARLPRGDVGGRLGTRRDGLRRPGRTRGPRGLRPGAGDRP